MYSACAPSVCASLFMLRLLSIIHAGTIHGLAHRCRSGLTCKAALMNGISFCRSRSMEKLAIV